MQVYLSILVPLDGSSLSEQALPLAIGIARPAAAAPVGGISEAIARMNL